MDGHVVHARHGARAHYHPVQSILSSSSRPQQVVGALLRLHVFRTLYIADLDAILGRGDNWRSIRAIGRQYPNLSLWIDAGLRTPHDLARWLRAGLGAHMVIGSESLSETALLGDLLLQNPAHYSVLSLDFQGEAFLGPADLDKNISIWPPRVILMTLARVGSHQGPDLDRLRQHVKLSPTTNWYVGGGVRDVADLRTLSAQGADGVLIASALHSGTISAADLAAVAD